MRETWRCTTCCSSLITRSAFAFGAASSRSSPPASEACSSGTHRAALFLRNSLTSAMLAAEDAHDGLLLKHFAPVSATSTTEPASVTVVTTALAHALWRCHDDE